MARTSKKAKVATAATVAEATTEADIRGVGDAASEAVAAAETTPETAAAGSDTIFIPLGKLKKSPRNARKTPAQRG